MTVTFREMAELRSRQAVKTIDITLPDRTLYLSDRGVTITNKYDAVVSSFGDTRISAGGLAGVTKTSDFEFTIANRKLGFQAEGLKFGDLFKDYLFLNAVVLEKIHLLQLDGTYLSATIFRGTIDQFKCESDGFRFIVIGDQSYNKVFPPTVFRKEDTGMSRLPDASSGLPIPVIYGDFWNTPGIDIIEADIEFVGITRNVIPAVLYDTVDPTTKCQNYRIASHALHSLDGTAQNSAPFLYERGVGLSSLTDSVDSWINNVAGSDVTLKHPMYAYAFVQPARDNGSTCTNPLNARDRDETTYAILDYNKDLILEMEPASGGGDIVAVYVDAIVQRVTSSDKLLEIGCTTSDTAEAYTQWPLTTDDPTYIYRTAITGDYMRNWNCIQQNLNPIKVFLRYEPAATVGQCKIYEIALCFKYRPSGIKGDNTVMPKWWKMPGWKLQDHKLVKVEPETEGQLNQSVFVNCKGHADDGSGTYTGTAGLVVGNPADIIHHLLSTYGGVASAQIVTSGFGSFVTARTELNSRVTGDFNIRYRWTQQSNLQAAIKRICEQCGLLYIEPSIDANHRLVAWKAAPSGDDYIYRAVADGGAVTFGWGWNYGVIPGTLNSEPTNRDDIINEVYINYRYDHAPGQFTKLTYVDAAYSAPNDDAREAVCAASQADYGVVKRLTVDADIHYLDTTAEWLRNWIVDTRATEKIIMSFDTCLWPYDLLPHHIIGTASTIDTHMKYPLKGSDGSWGSKQFRADEVTRMSDTRSAIRIRVKGISL